MPERIAVYGYHGTHREAAESILRDGFRASSNAYDWLGYGIYFWQDAPERAWEWASQPERHGSAAAVIGALIHLDDCMDLLDITWERRLQEAYASLVEELTRANRRVPRQTRGAHRLDCAVVDHLIAKAGERDEGIRVARAAFREGIPVFPGSALYTHSHVQIAVRDHALIEYYWRVR